MFACDAIYSLLSTFLLIHLSVRLRLTANVAVNSTAKKKKVHGKAESVEGERVEHKTQIGSSNRTEQKRDYTSSKCEG